MAEDAKEPAIYPSDNLPAVFTDGVANLATSQSLARFYMIRFDPTLDGSGSSRPVPVCQVVMPIDSFVNMTAFFQSGIEDLISAGKFTQEKVDEMRKRQISDDEQ